MAKRGRPRHPDVLTPREWEVLALLRERFTNEQIAAQLSITERTAKFHVSEILSKLGVSSREEAAAWQPGEPRSWWATALAPPAVLRRNAGAGWLPAVSAAVVAAAVLGGLSLLGWGLIRAGGQRDGAGVVPATVMPVSAEAFTDNGVPTTYLSQPGGLRPIDPATGEGLQGYRLVSSWGLVAISPDGTKAAIALLTEPPGLELFDLLRWETVGELGNVGYVEAVRWSPD